MAKTPTSPASTAEDLAKLRRLLASQQHLIEKLKKIRALYVTTYSSVHALDKMGTEFINAVGDVLEGRKAEDLNFRLIDRNEFMRELTDG